MREAGANLLSTLPIDGSVSNRTWVIRQDKDPVLKFRGRLVRVGTGILFNQDLNEVVVE